MFNRRTTPVPPTPASPVFGDATRTLIGFFLPTSVAQRRAFAGLIATAIDERIPLAPLLRAWAADERGWQAMRVERLATLLESGTPLDVALAKVPGCLRPADATGLRVATRLGTGARGALAESDDAGNDAVEQNVRGTLVYAGTVGFVFLIIAAFIAVRIHPMFTKIFQEFGMEMPVWSRVANGVVDGMTPWGLVVPVLLLVFLLLPLRLRRRLWREVGLGGLGVLGDARSAAVLDTLGVAATWNRSPDAALASLGGATDDVGLAARLRRAAAGGAIGAALERAGLATRSEAELIDVVPGRHGTWVTHALARSRRQRVAERVWIASELLLPLIVLVMGAFVLMEAFGLMTPLFQLIVGLT